MRMKYAAVLFTSICMLASCKNEGPILIAGSSCMGELARALCESYGGNTEVQLGGTALGLSALTNGRTDIAACSRELLEDDVGVTGFKVAVDAVAVAVNPSNPIVEISKKQLVEIYTGQITNWSQLGGEDSPIVIIGREAGSGTRSAFESSLNIENADHSQELPESGMIRTAVAALENSIGYFSLADADESVKLLAVDGIKPTTKTTLSGEYPITRPFIFVIRDDENRKEIMNFIDYVLKEGQKTVKALGYASVIGEEKR